METPKKKVYQPGEGSEVETAQAPSDPGTPEQVPELPLEEGSGDYVEEQTTPEEADESYAKHRSEDRGE